GSHVVLGRRREPAPEPFSGQMKGNDFQSPKSCRVQRTPPVPEFFVVALRFQKIRDLEDVRSAHAPAQQMPKQMKRGVSDSVDRVEYGQSILINTSRPELFHAGSAEALGRWIPELKMQIDSRRNFRIIKITAP